MIYFILSGSCYQSVFNNHMFGRDAVGILADNSGDNCWWNCYFLSDVFLPQGEKNILIGRNFIF